MTAAMTQYLSPWLLKIKTYFLILHNIIKTAYYYLYYHFVVKILHGSVLPLGFFNSRNTGLSLIANDSKRKEDIVLFFILFGF